MGGWQPEEVGAPAVTGVHVWRGHVTCETRKMMEMRGVVYM